MTSTMKSQLLFVLLSSLAHSGVLAAAVVQSTAKRSLRAFNTPDTEQAVKRLEAVEDIHSSKVLCRITGSQGQPSVTVRLQPSDNARSLVFNDDATGVETRVRCSGAPDPACFSVAPSAVNDVEQCPQCGCSKSAGELYGAYAKAIADEVGMQCGHVQRADDLESAHFRVLLLGLGGGELATHLAKACGSGDSTSLDIEAVELDGRLPVLARRYFGLPDSVKTSVGDAFFVVSDLEQQVAGDALLADQRRYDDIVVDCFSTGGVVPEHCRSEEFVTKLRGLLRTGGRVFQHIWHVDEEHPQVPADFSHTVATYRKIFDCKGCDIQVKPLEGGPDSLIIASYTSQQ